MVRRCAGPLRDVGANFSRTSEDTCRFGPVIRCSRGSDVCKGQMVFAGEEVNEIAQIGDELGQAWCKRG